MQIKRGYPVNVWPVDYWPDLPYIGGSVTDGIAAADLAARLLAALGVAADSAAAGDSLTRLMQATRTAADGMEAGDAPAAGLSVGVTIADGYIIGQLPNGAGVFAVSVADALAAGDSVSRLIEAIGLVSLLFELRQPGAAFALRRPTITISREVSHECS